MNSIVEGIARYAKSQPDKLCLADGDGNVTYEEYFRKVLGFSRYLEGLGIRKGEPVLVKLNQKISFLASGLAIQLLGAVFVPLEKAMADARVREIAAITNARYVIAEQESDYGCDFLPFSLVDEHDWQGEIPYRELAFPDGLDTAEILFSTGTTGKSKGIELTHASVVAVSENVKYGVEMKKDNVELIPVPLNHSHGLRRYYANMLNGSTVIVMEGVVFVDKLFKQMDAYRVTSMDLVPAMLSIILKLSKKRLGDYKERLDYIQIGSAKLSDQDKEDLRNLLPGVRLYDFYGSTEAGCSSILEFSKYPEKKNCIGRPTRNSVFKFVDEEGSEIQTSPETFGLMASGGTMLMKGYYKDPELTSETLREGFIHSSDEGYMGRDGFLYLMGRRGDVINIGGMKVDPLEIEEKAMRNPDIEDCACVPMKDEIAGQAPKLYVVMKKGGAFSPIAIRDRLDKELEAYKLPKAIEEIESIPRTYNGKIIRNKLV